MPKKSAKSLWREQAVMDVVWKHRFSGGVTASVIAEDTAPEGKNTGVSGRMLNSVLWVLFRRGQIIAGWLPGKGGKGARFAILPGMNEYKAREQKKVEEPKTPKAVEPENRALDRAKLAARLLKEGKSPAEMARLVAEAFDESR